MTVTGRLAPSPTGAQHLGNARTYLLAWLSARHQNGHVVFRLEDIDSPRVKADAVRQAMDDLRWLGLDWDEGPDVGGLQGPYVQTQRTDWYDRAIALLRERDALYPCTCSRSDIDEASSAPHEQLDGPVYPGTCASWREGDALPPANTFCWRMRTSALPRVIRDEFRGDMSLNVAAQLGDFPVTRKNLQSAYQLAVVIDDDAMGVTEVVRGDDLWPSAFRQQELIECLSLKTPRYFHVPLVVGADGRRLAKRHGDTRLCEYRARGVKAEQIIGWAAHSAGLIEQATPIKARELVESFDWSRVSRDRVVVNSELWP